MGAEMEIRDLLARFVRPSAAGRSRRPDRLNLELLEERTTPTAAINLVANSYSVPSGLSQLVPLSLVTQPTLGTQVIYNATSTNPQVTTQVLTSNEAWDLTVTGKDSSGKTFSGDLIIQLFPSESPAAVQRIVQLTNSGFYNGLTFHRVIQGFVAQGGDPNGNGSGGSSLGSFQDQFAADLSFNSPGMVAFANSGPDTNNSQFFITAEGLPLTAEPTFLDFRYDIYGQLVSGFATFNSLMSTPVGANSVGENSKPVTNVVISKAQIINDPAVAVLKISAPSSFQGKATLNISADDGSGASTSTFGVTYVPPTVNNPPFLGPIANQTTFANTPVSFQIPATDIEGDQLTYVVTDPSNFGVNNAPPNVSVSINQATGVATVSPAANFTGTVNMLVGVRDQTARNSDTNLNDKGQFDTHAITLTVLPDNNQAPIINPITLPPVADGTTLTFTAYAVAPNAGTAVPLTYSLAAGAPAGASIDPSSGVVTWTPSNANNQPPGTYSLTVQATETVAPSLTGTQTFSIIVGPTSTVQGSGMAARSTVARGVTQSTEYYTNFVTAAYLKYLGRAPDAYGLAYWVAQMQHNGLSDEQLEAGFLSSPEFINDSGGPGANFVNGLYVTLLGRTPAPNEVAYWVNQLNNGMTANQVALGFTTSKEREADRVAADYQQYLGRSTSSSEIQYWVNVFVNGGSNEKVIAGFLSSQEYFQDHGDNIVDWLYADYRAALNREPDSFGLQYWETVLR
jgi:cyclophilin family peptidyl-prolyl cis-trans isomerase